MDPDVIDPEGFQKLLEQLGVDIFGVMTHLPQSPTDNR